MQGKSTGLKIFFKAEILGLFNIRVILAFLKIQGIYGLF